MLVGRLTGDCFMPKVDMRSCPSIGCIDTPAIITKRFVGDHDAAFAVPLRHKSQKAEGILSRNESSNAAVPGAASEGRIWIQ